MVFITTIMRNVSQRQGVLLNQHELSSYWDPFIRAVAASRNFLQFHLLNRASSEPPLQIPARGE